MSEELIREELPAIRELGSTEAGQIHCLAIVGEIEGHTLLPAAAKTTKYEHVMPLLAAVADGSVKYRYEDDKEDYVCVGIGLVEIANNEVRILPRTAEPADKIDIIRAESARTRAKERLQKHYQDTDPERIKESLRRAEARLRTRRLYEEHTGGGRA